MHIADVFHDSTSTGTTYYREAVKGIKHFSAHFIPHSLNTFHTLFYPSSSPCSHSFPFHSSSFPRSGSIKLRISNLFSLFFFFFPHDISKFNTENSQKKKKHQPQTCQPTPQHSASSRSARSSKPSCWALKKQTSSSASTRKSSTSSTTPHTSARRSGATQTVCLNKLAY